MNVFKKSYLFPIALLCILIITGCNLGETSAPVVPPVVKTGPVVTYTVNANGSTDVFVNTKIGAFFSTEMDPSTINSSTFTVNQGTTPVSGTISYNGLSAIFTPDTNLIPLTEYTAAFSTDVKDLEGNAMVESFTWSWTTGSQLDSIIPEVIHTVNLNGATDVYLNTAIIATFNKVMDASTISESTVSFMQGTTIVPGIWLYTGVSLVFKPTELLAPSTQYTTTITTAVKDLAGNPLSSDVVLNWTTGTSMDMSVPSVIFTTPAYGKSVISHGVLIVSATFSEDMDPLTITPVTYTLSMGTTAIVGTVLYNGLTKTASFIPANELIPGATYTARINNNVKNSSGISMTTAEVWNFTTSALEASLGVDLGSAINFAILAGSTITNTGITTITGDVGLSPGTAVTGFPPGVLNGTYYIGTDDTALTAKLDLTAAYNDAAGRTLGVMTVATQLGGTTLLPGVYNSDSGTFNLTGVLILDGQANPDAVFIFQAASTLITAASSSIVLSNGTQAKNVFWAVGSSATIGANTLFMGTIMAQASITLASGATIDGRALTRTAAVTLDANTITSTAPVPTAPPTPVPTPEPTQWPVNLGTASTYAILAGATITNTGLTTITGDIGLAPGSAITGFPPGIWIGNMHISDSAAVTAKQNLTAAYTDAANRANAIIVPSELGGTTLTSGIYKSADGSLGITGILTLDGQDNPDAIFIFQAASTLITGTSSSIVLINGALAKNVYWTVGSSATLSPYTLFKGTIMAQASITITTGASIIGRALTESGAVTLDTVVITVTP